MIVAIDFDQTYTADREMWESVMETIKSHGHDIYCVTCREEWDTGSKQNGIPRIMPYVDKVFFTNGMAKIPFMQEIGYHVDIWIDDCPATVTGGGSVMYKDKDYES